MYTYKYVHVYIYKIYIFYVYIRLYIYIIEYRYVYDSKHSYFIMILFNFEQFMPVVSTKIITLKSYSSFWDKDFFSLVRYRQRREMFLKFVGHCRKRQCFGTWFHYRCKWIHCLAALSKENFQDISSDNFRYLQFSNDGKPLIFKMILNNFKYQSIFNIYIFDFKLCNILYIIQNILNYV